MMSSLVDSPQQVSKLYRKKKHTLLHQIEEYINLRGLIA